MAGLSIERAHQLLGLQPRTFLPKQEIHEAYRRAAKKYHPDARYPDSTPCAMSFRHCQDALEALMKYYYGNPGIQMRKHARRRQAPPVDLSPAIHHMKYRKYTMGLKAAVLLAVACEGVLDSFKKKKEDYTM